MKKMFSYLLALTLLVSTMSAGFAAPADVTDKNEQKAVDVLMALGVVEGYDDGSYKPQRVVSRAEMAKLMVVALGFEEMVAGSTNDFTDVIPNHWAAGYIGVCVDLGIVEGYGDGRFGPEDPVKYSEAATMLVRALGWTNESLGGIWPTNYVSKAMGLDIFEGVDYKDKGAVRGDIAEMIFNTLELPIGKVNQNGEYTSDPDDTMLKRCGAMVLDEAQVYEGVGDTSTNLIERIGHYSRIYKLLDGTKTIMTIDAAPTLEGIKVNNKKFKVGNKEYTFEVPASDKFYIYKNTEKSTIAVDTSGLTNGEKYILSLDLNGSKINKIYAASIWIPSDAAVIKNSNLTEINNNKKLFGAKFDLDDQNKIDYKKFQLMGVNKLTDIKKNDVVIIYKKNTSANAPIRKVAVSDKLIENAKISMRDGGKLTINGKVYEASKAPGAVSDLATNPIYNPANQKRFDFRLDYFGKIYAVSPSGQVEYGDYAVALATSDGSNDPFSPEEAKLRLFLANGTSKIFEVKAVEGTSSLLNADKTWKRKEEGNLSSEPVLGVQDIVKFGCNADDKIVSLKTLAPDTTSGIDIPIVGNLIKSGAYQALITNETKVYTFDTIGDEPANAKKYGVMTVADFKNLGKFTGKVARVKGEAKAVIVTGLTSPEIYTVISKTEVEVSGGYQVKAFANGVENTYVSPSDPNVALFELRKVTLNGNVATFYPVILKDDLNLYLTNYTNFEANGNVIKAANGDNYSYIVLDESVQIYKKQDGSVGIISLTDFVAKLNDHVQNGNVVNGFYSYDRDGDDDKDFLFIDLQ